MKRFFFVRGGVWSPKSSEYFDPEQGRWVVGPKLKQDRIRHCMVGHDGKLVLIGGVTGGASMDFYNMNGLRRRKWRRGRLLGYRFRFQKSRKTCSKFVRFILTFDRHSCVLLPGEKSVLVFGGKPRADIYNLDTLTLEKSEIKTIVNRTNGKGLLMNGKTLLFGGDQLSLT